MREASEKFSIGLLWLILAVYVSDVSDVSEFLRFFVWHLQGFGSIPHMIPLSNSKFALVFESFEKF